MSPPPSEAVEVAAAPGAALTGARHGRFLRLRVGTRDLRLELLHRRARPKVLLEAVQLYADPANGAQVGHPIELAQALAALPPALAALQGVLDAGHHGLLRSLVCDVAIDDSWMLYDVVRADLLGMAPRAADALVAASLADVAGVTPAEIESRWHTQGGSFMTLACGMPASALPALLAALRAHGIVPGAIEGEFVQAFNAQRERLHCSRAVLALAGDAGTQLGVLVDGALAAMSFEYGVDNPRELEQRGRGLLRVLAAIGSAGHTDDAVRFFALGAGAFAQAEPWVCLQAAP